MDLKKLKHNMIGILVAFYAILFLHFLFNSCNIGKTKEEKELDEKILNHSEIIEVPYIKPYHTMYDSAIYIADSIRDNDYRWMYNDDYWNAVGIADSIVQATHEKP